MTTPKMNPHLPQAVDDSFLLDTAPDELNDLLLANDRGGAAKHITGVSGDWLTFTDGVVTVDEAAIAAHAAAIAAGEVDELTGGYTIEMAKGAYSSAEVTTWVASSQNMLTNGSFEDATFQTFFPSGGGSGWGFADVTGWNNTNDTIEVWNTPFLGATATDGARLIETDSDTRVDDISQSVSVHDGYHYVLTFDFRSRADGPGLATDSDAFEIWWNGSKVATYDPNSTDWSHAVLDLVGGGSSDALEIREAGANDSWGALLDNFKLVVDPDLSGWFVV